MDASNEDILARIDALECKVDRLISKLEQASGVWTFIKWVAGVALGASVIAGAVHDWWVK